MCGRVVQKTALSEIRVLFKTVNPVPNAAPTYNGAPTDTMPVVRLDRDGRRSLDLPRWGLVPWWAKDLKSARAASMRWPRLSRRNRLFEMPSPVGSVASCRSTLFTSGRRHRPASSLTQSSVPMAYRSPWRACGNAGGIGGLAIRSRPSRSSRPSPTSSVVPFMIVCRHPAAGEMGDLVGRARGRSRRAAVDGPSAVPSGIMRALSGRAARWQCAEQ